MLQGQFTFGKECLMADKHALFEAFPVQTFGSRKTSHVQEVTFFIDNGRLAAFGKHTDLYETCDAYRKMVDLQKLEEEGGNHDA